METINTIKGIEVIAYKGMKSDMTCRDFQYEIGKTYKTDKVELCEIGFHACLNPRDVLYYYYPKKNSRYFKVKLSGGITKCDEYDTKVTATEITILEEIPTDKFLTNTEWWKSENVLDLLYFSDGFARIKRGDRLWNLIDKNGKFLSKQWFNWVDDFKAGFARVQRGNRLWNLIDKKGNYLSDEWFIDAHSFKDGIARVQRSDKKYNFINKNGKFLSNEWFNYLDDFRDGFARVQRTNDEYAKIDKSGNLIKILQ